MLEGLLEKSALAVTPDAANGITGRAPGKKDNASPRVAG
jgi:hypothetical protein